MVVRRKRGVKDADIYTSNVDTGVDPYKSIPSVSTFIVSCTMGM